MDLTECHNADFFLVFPKLAFFNSGFFCLLFRIAEMSPMFCLGNQCACTNMVSPKHCAFTVDVS